MVVVVGDVEPRAARVGRDPLWEAQAQRRRAQLRWAGRSQRGGVEDEPLDAVVALVGDEHDRRRARRCLPHGDPARADATARARHRAARQVEDARVAERRPKRAVGGVEDLDAVVLGVEHVDVPAAVDRHAADDPQSAGLPPAGPRAEREPERPIRIEGLDDPAELITDEDRSAPGREADRLGEAEHPTAVRRLADHRRRQGGRRRSSNGRAGNEHRHDQQRERRPAERHTHHRSLTATTTRRRSRACDPHVGPRPSVRCEVLSGPASGTTRASGSPRRMRVRPATSAALPASSAPRHRERPSSPRRLPSRRLPWC